MDRPAGVADQSVSFAAWTTATGAAVTVTSASAGLALWYRRGVAGAKVALASINDLATLETAHNDEGILVIGGQEHRLDLPDAAFAAGATYLEWGGEATGITIDGGCCNLIGQANTATDVSHIKGTASPADAGYVAPDWGQVKNPTTTVALTNTTINDAQKVDLNTVKTRAVADYGSGHTYYLGGDDAANGAAGGIAIVGSNMGTVTLANGAHGGAAATLVLSDYSAFKATGFSTLTAQQVWEYTTRTLSAFSFTVAATGNWTTDADIAQLLSDLATAHGAGSWATATSVTVSDKSGFSLASTGLDLVTAWTVDITGTVSGNSTHTAANVKTAIEADGSKLDVLYDDWLNGGRLDLLLDAAAAGGAGTGARTCTITVDDGSNALESARIRVTKGAESYVQETDVSGQAVFNLDDGSWTVAITCHGYNYSGTTLVVDDDETETYSMTAASFTPSTEPDTVTVRWTVMGSDDFLAVGAGVSVYIRIKTPPTDDGYIWGKGNRTGTTDANGLVEFTDVPVGCTLLARCGSTGEWVEIEIPDDATSPYDAGEFVGIAET